MAELVVTAGALPAAGADLRRQVDALGRAVEEADHLVAVLGRSWTGDAARTFGAAWMAWDDAAAALRANLAELRELLDTTEANYAAAQRATLRAWSGSAPAAPSIPIAPLAPAVVAMSAAPGGVADAPPWVTLSTPEIVQAARASADAQASVAAAAGRGGLEAGAGFAGDDAALSAWRGRYDVIARRAWEAIGAGVSIFGGMAVGLTDTANAWVEADETAIPGGGPGERLPAPAVLRGLAGPGPSPATGPGMIGPVPAELAAYWPDVDAARVEQVGDVWRTVGDAVARAVVDTDRALVAVRGANAGPVFDAIERYWAGVQGPGSGTVLDLATRVPGVLATTLGNLAEIVRETQREIGDAIAHFPIGDDHEETYHLLQAAKHGASLLGAVGRVGTRLIDAAETGLRVHLARRRYEERVAQLVLEMGVIPEPEMERSTAAVTTVGDVAASLVDAPQGPGEISVPLVVDRKQIERKYDKHAEDFGVDLPRGAAGFAEVTRRLHELVEAPMTRHTSILYRGEPAVANYDPATRLCVIQREDGSFLSGWRLSPDQYVYVTTRRYLR